MKLKSLILENYGPFSQYQLDFPSDEKAAILLSGKNNAGKSSIIRALKLLNSAMKHAKQTSQPIYAELPKKDIDDINIERYIHNYQTNGKAVVTGVLDTGRHISVSLNSKDNTIYYELPSYAHRSMSDLLGFVPQLGQLAEKESLVSEKHLLATIDTTLAPRHLRNHIYQLLNEDEKTLVQKIFNESWEGIEIQNIELDQDSGILLLLYNEDKFVNEIALAGQGMQIWIQIITHMVRLINKSMLVLDEPELFLHPQKQHDLMRILNEYYNGSIIIATHSSELMNSVDISHIVHVQKNVHYNKMIQVSNRNELEIIRSSIGSGFNLVASQFEDVEMLIATENQLDYDIIHQLALTYGINTRTQNVRISGFGNRDNAIYYKRAYSLFFGKDVKCSLLLDRDYYPNAYLDHIKEEMAKYKVNVLYTPGKEIENLFLDENFLLSLAPKGFKEKLHEYLDNLYKSEYDNCFPKYLEFYNKHSVQRELTISYKDIKPSFDVCWYDANRRHILVNGKNMLAKVRDYFKTQYNVTLTTNLLTEQLAKMGNSDTRVLVSSLLT